LGDVVEIHKPTLFYAFVALPLVAVIGTVVRASQPVQLDVLAKLVALVVVGAALIMGWTLFRLRESLRNGIAATAEIVDASPWAGRIRVNLDGRPLVSPPVIASRCCLIPGKKQCFSRWAGRGSSP